MGSRLVRTLKEQKTGNWLYFLSFWRNMIPAISIMQTIQVCIIVPRQTIRCVINTNTLAVARGQWSALQSFVRNMSGRDKLKPLLIGKSKRPRCFKAIAMDTLPIVMPGWRAQYSNNGLGIGISFFCEIVENYYCYWTTVLHTR